MTNINKTSPEPGEDKTSNKPNTLSREHQGKSSVTAGAESATVSFPVLTQILDDIPTLTEKVFLSPEILPLQPESQVSADETSVPSDIIVDLSEPPNLTTIFMSLNKRYEPRPIEERWYPVWQSAG